MIQLSYQAAFDPYHAVFSRVLKKSVVENAVPVVTV